MCRGLMVKRERKRDRRRKRKLLRSRQSRRASVIEAIANTGIGFGGSMLLWVFFVAPVFGFESQHAGMDAFLITCIFTVWSLVRNYVIRRIFSYV